MKKSLLFVFIALLTFAACEKDDEKQDRIDRKKILDYLQKNNIVAEETESGLFYVIEEEGSGNHPTSTSVIKVFYKGSLLNGYVFDSTEGQSTPATFQLAYLIQGWRQGIPLFKKGGKGKLIIPSRLGYGSVTYHDIPANSVLVFDIHLVDFQ